MCTADKCGAYGKNWTCPPYCGTLEECETEKACSSMEGYGLFVAQVCRDNGLPYHHGEKTVTYTACLIF